MVEGDYKRGDTTHPIKGLEPDLTGSLLDGVTEAASTVSRIAARPVG